MTPFSGLVDHGGLHGSNDDDGVGSTEAIFT